MSETNSMKRELVARVSKAAIASCAAGPWTPGAIPEPWCNDARLLVMDVELGLMSVELWIEFGGEWHTEEYTPVDPGPITHHARINPVRDDG